MQKQSEILQKEMSTRTVGIDFGTKWSNIAIYKDDSKKFEFFHTNRSHRLLKSQIYLTWSDVKVGYAVDETFKNKNISSLFYDIKRFLGRQWNDLDLKKIDSKLLFCIHKDESSNSVVFTGPPKDVENANSTSHFNLYNNENIHIPPEYLAAILLRRICRIAQLVDTTIQHFIIGFPTSWNNTQRLALRDSVSIADLPNVYFYTEAVLAGITYIHDNSLIATVRETKQDVYFAVADLGGGSFDICIIRVFCNPKIDNEVIIKVVANGGDIDLGSQLVDQYIYSLVESSVNKKMPTLLHNLKVKIIVQRECEAAKVQFSNRESMSTTIAIPDENGKNIFQVRLTRVDFLRLCSKFYQRITDNFQSVLLEVQTTLTSHPLDSNPTESSQTPPSRSAQAANPDIESTKLECTFLNDVILIGGGSKMAGVTQAIQKAFTYTSDKLTSRTKMVKLTDINFYEDFTEHETVARGAAILGAFMDNKLDKNFGNFNLIVTCPHSISLLQTNNKLYPLIKKNAELPFSRCFKIFVSENAKQLNVCLVEGDNEVANHKSNHRLCNHEVSRNVNTKTMYTIFLSMNDEYEMTCRLYHPDGKIDNICLRTNKVLTEEYIQKLKEDVLLHCKNLEVVAMNISDESDKSNAVLEAAEKIAKSQDVQGFVSAAMKSLIETVRNKFSSDPEMCVQKMRMIIVKFEKDFNMLKNGKIPQNLVLE